MQGAAVRLLRHRRTDGAARIAPNHSHCLSHPSEVSRRRAAFPRAGIETARTRRYSLPVSIVLIVS